MRNGTLVFLGSLLAAYPVLVLGQGIPNIDDSFTYEGTCPNPPPNYCDCVPDTVGFAAAWPVFPGYASCSVRSEWANATGCQTNSGYRGWSVPFSLFRQKAVQINYKDLAAIASGIDPTKNAVNGTDANPLVLTMWFYCAQTTGSEDNTTFHVQLIAEEEMAPTTHMIESPVAPGEMVEAPLVLIHDEADCSIRQNVTADAPARAIAFGFYGGDLGIAPKAYAKWYKDTFGIELPCQLRSDVNTMIGYNVLYDGTRWMQLNENFPVSGPGIPASLRQTYLQMTIKSTTIDLFVDSRDDGVAGVTRTGIARGYLGGFQKIVLGSKVFGNYPIYADDVTLSGGELTYVMSTAAGACCRGDHTCEMLPQLECEAIEGATFKGVGTQCGIGDGRCCADPMVDGDNDGDVDMTDFAMMQRCLTSGLVTPGVADECKCFDTDDDGDIDVFDFTNFTGSSDGSVVGCVSGPGIAADPSCDDNF